MDKPVYLGLSVLYLIKTVMCEFWYDCVKPKYCERAKLRYMDTDSLIFAKTLHDIYKGIAEDVETRFDTSHFDWINEI